MSVSLFPYENVRKHQDELIKEINQAVQNKTNVIAQAPTGLGKTSASLAATLSNTLQDSSKVVVFLTGMHTQHQLALDTIKDIKRAHDVKIIGVDIIGKKHLCLQQGVKNLSAGDFLDYCKALRGEGKCQYFNNLKKGDEYSFETKLAIQDFKRQSPTSPKEALEISEKHKVCPYEASLIVGKKANVIVTDYFYLFNPKIREGFLNKIGKDFEDLVVIIDEAHNLPGRVKELASKSLSNIVIKRALSEAQNFQDDEIIKALNEINGVLREYAKNIDKEGYVSKYDFVDSINMVYPIAELIKNLEKKADEIREEQKISYLGNIANFLEEWQRDQEGFTRIFQKNKGYSEDILSLTYTCLDPAVITRPVIEKVNSTIMMSGTLNPTHMYKQIMGFDEAKELTLESPFPQENSLNIIIPQTSTKYSQRSPKQYSNIAKHLLKIINNVPGNSAVFFPSYKLRDDIYKYMQGCKKTVFLEMQGMNKNERETILNKFKTYKESGAVLLGISSGSFAEGVDLPGDLLKAVVVVGLPLRNPDLETKALIKYYDQKFKQGWDYGYVYPAFNKTLQSAGRCIRSSTDRGVIVFLDERYSWPNYQKCFPKTWNMKTTVLYENQIIDFFKNKK